MNSLRPIIHFLKKYRIECVFILFLGFYTLVWSSDWLQTRYTLPPSDDAAVHILLSRLAQTGDIDQYPPLLHWVMIGVASFGFSEEKLLIFLPMGILGVGYPVLTYLFLIKLVPHHKKNILFGILLTFTHVPLLLQQAFVQSYAEILAILFILLCLNFLIREQYAVAIINLGLSLFTHHLSAPLFLIAFLMNLFLLMCFIIIKKLVYSEKMRLHTKKYFTSIAIFFITLTIVISVIPTYQEDVLMRFIRSIIPQEEASNKNIKFAPMIPDRVIDAPDETREAPPHTKLRSIASANKADDIFVIFFLFGGAWVIQRIIRHKRERVALGALGLWAIVPWITAQFPTDAPHLNVRLIRMLIYPALFIAAIGATYLLNYIPRFWKTVAISCIAISGIFSLLYTIHGKSSGSNFIRLTTGDFAAIEYINTHATAKDAVLTTTSYATWLDVKLQPMLYTTTLRPEQHRQNMIPFWMIFQTQDSQTQEVIKKIVEQYGIRYIYQGGPVPGRKNTIDIEALTETDHWKIVFQNDRATILEYQADDNRKKEKF